MKGRKTSPEEIDCHAHNLLINQPPAAHSPIARSTRRTGHRIGRTFVKRASLCRHRRQREKRAMTSWLSLPRLRCDFPRGQKQLRCLITQAMRALCTGVAPVSFVRLRAREWWWRMPVNKCLFPAVFRHRFLRVAFGCVWSPRWGLGFDKPELTQSQRETR